MIDSGWPPTYGEPVTATTGAILPIGARDRRGRHNGRRCTAVLASCRNKRGLLIGSGEKTR